MVYLEENLNELSQRELEMKKVYFNGGQQYFESPLSVLEYEKYIEEGKLPVLEDEYADYYKSKTENGLGTTNENVERLTNGRKIDVVPHPKYSLPIIHNHLYIEVIYVYSGSCRHFIENDSFVMKQGDLCILAPSTHHALSVVDDETFVINVLVSKKIFDSVIIDALKNNEKNSLLMFIEQVLYNKEVNPYLLFRTKNDDYIKSFIIEMFKERSEMLYKFETNLYLILVQLFIRIVRMYDNLAKIKTNESFEKKDVNSYMEAILAYVSLNYNIASLQDTADFFGFDASYLGKKIKQYTGHNFAALINDLQVTNAKRLLEFSSLNITEICNEVGCYDSSHLSKKFKAKFGQTPIQFRKSLSI